MCRREGLLCWFIFILFSRSSPGGVLLQSRDDSWERREGGDFCVFVDICSGSSVGEERGKRYRIFSDGLGGNMCLRIRM